MRDRFLKIGTATIFLFLIIQETLLLSRKMVAVPILFANEDSEDFSEEIELYAGQLKTLPAVNPKRVSVSNPEIVEVQSVASDEVVIEPRAAGRATLSISDDAGEHTYQFRVVHEGLAWVKKHADTIIHELNFPGISTKINAEEGKILLMGEVNELNDKERLLSALASLKEKFLDLVTIKEERTLVQIDVQILEIGSDDVKTLGIDYQASVALTDDANKKMNKIIEMFATSMWTRAKLDVTINMLVKESKARILSQPKLVCLSGKEAEFLVGGQVPIVTSTVSSTGTTTNATFKDYGISLKIKPTVREDANIFLNLSIEVSDIDTVNAVKTTQGTIPAFSTRNAKSELYLKDGQSVIIAGLIKNKDSNIVKKFPFLGDVPVLGLLWRSRDFQKNQTELVILLTPTVVQRYQPAKMPVKLRPQGTEQGYIKDLRSRLSSSIAYPGLAGELGAKGTVKVRLRILSDGQLKDAYVFSSSGSELLDASAIKTIKNLAPFPSFPSSFDTGELSVDIPIVYR